MEWGFAYEFSELGMEMEFANKFLQLEMEKEICLYVSQLQWNGNFPINKFPMNVLLAPQILNS